MNKNKVFINVNTSNFKTILESEYNDTEFIENILRMDLRAFDTLIYNTEIDDYFYGMLHEGYHEFLEDPGFLIDSMIVIDAVSGEPVDCTYHEIPERFPELLI